jgi:hypothetical protein
MPDQVPVPGLSLGRRVARDAMLRRAGADDVPTPLEDEEFRVWT